MNYQLAKQPIPSSIHDSIFAFACGLLDGFCHTALRWFVALCLPVCMQNLARLVLGILRNGSVEVKELLAWMIFSRNKILLSEAGA